MILAVCVDSRNAMRFNGRRQSRDRVVLADLLVACAGQPLWIHPASATLFAHSDASLSMAEDFLACAGTGEWCFAEDGPLAPVAHRIEALVLYRWNRVYPADVFLDIDPAALGLALETTQELTGYSHPQITKEIYRRSVTYGQEKESL